MVYSYWDEEEKKSIDILSCVDRPYKGVTSYGTIGLSQHNIGLLSNNKNLTVELLGACDEKEEYFPNIVATTAFEIMEAANCGYGHIIPNVISQYITKYEMKHIYLMNPFLWDGFKTIEFEDRKVAWLLIIPISNNEKEYVITNGWNALERKFQEASIDVFNLKRKSIL